MGWIILGEGISGNLIVSALIIFVGVFIFYRNEINSRARLG